MLGKCLIVKAVYRLVSLGEFSRRVIRLNRTGALILLGSVVLDWKVLISVSVLVGPGVVSRVRLVSACLALLLGVSRCLSVVVVLLRLCLTKVTFVLIRLRLCVVGLSVC